MAKVDYEVMNELFIERAFTNEGMAKEAAAALEGPLRTHIREGCLMNQVWAMVDAPRSRQQKDLNDPTQNYIYDEIEPDWVAMVMTHDGMPEGHFYSAQACATYFYPIRSKEEIITKDRVRGMSYSIEDYFKKHIGNEVARQRDIRFRAMLDEAVDATGQVVNVTSAIPQAKDLLSAIDLIDSQTHAEIFGTDIIMHYSFMNKILKGGPAEFDIGAYEIFKDGYKQGRILGRRLHLTRKKEFPVNEVFVVADKEFVATNYEDYPLIFEAKMDLDEIKMKAKCSVGSLIYNTYGISKLSWTEA